MDRFLSRLAVVIAAAMLVASCGGGDDGDGTASGSTTLPRSLPLEVEVTENTPYHAPIEGYREALLDVYAPTEGGPWPVVVMWHEGGGLLEDKDQWDQLAPLVAEQGAVVVTPTYGTNAPEDYRNLQPDPAYFPTTERERACVLAFVSASAADFRGDPSRVVAFGGSGGANQAGATVWQENRVGEGCLADGEQPATPEILVLNEGDWLLSPLWDPVLANGALDFAEATVWDDLERSADTEVHILLGGERSPNHTFAVGDPFDDQDCGRPIEPGTGITISGAGLCRWFELRDPDGSLRRDAQELGLFDDGWFGVTDASRLLAARLEAAGQEPVVTTVEGLSHGVTTEEATLMAPALIEIIQG